MRWHSRTSSRADARASSQALTHTCGAKPDPEAAKNAAVARRVGERAKVAPDGRNPCEPAPPPRRTEVNHFPMWTNFPIDGTPFLFTAKSM